MIVDDKVLVVAGPETHGIDDLYEFNVVSRGEVIGIQPLPDAIFYTWEAFGLYVETRLQDRAFIRLTIGRAE